MTPSTDVNPMFEQAVCFAFTLTRPGTSRKVSAEHIETDADKALLSISKQILQSNEFDAIVGGGHRADPADLAPGPL